MDAVTKEIKEIMFDTFKLSIDDELSPRMDLHKEPELLGTMMFSNQSIDSLSDAKPDVNHPMSENPRGADRQKERFAFDKDGKPFSKMKQFQLRDGIFEAIIDRFYKDASLVAYGEENRDWGGAFAVYRGPDRGTCSLPPPVSMRRSPGRAIIGTAIGYAMCGGRVIPEIMYCDFLGCCGDEVFNQLPKWQAIERQHPQDARGRASVGRFEIRCATLAGLDFAGGTYPWPEGRVPRYAL
ncbi:MAG: hypothetical protein ACLR8Y_16950 [Alistipes indistinctus]